MMGRVKKTKVVVAEKAVPVADKPGVSVWLSDAEVPVMKHICRIALSGVPGSDVRSLVSKILKQFE